MNIVEYTNEVVYLDDQEIAIIKDNKLTIKNIEDLDFIMSAFEAGDRTEIERADRRRIEPERARPLALCLPAWRRLGARGEPARLQVVLLQELQVENQTVADAAVAAALGLVVWLASRTLRRGTGLSQGRRACPSCWGPVSEPYFRCPECGHALKTHCPACSRVVETKWTFCPFCSTELEQQTTTQPQTQEK